jgi:hypothetical protein
MAEGVFRLTLDYAESMPCCSNGKGGIFDQLVRVFAAAEEVSRMNASRTSIRPLWPYRTNSVRRRCRRLRPLGLFFAMLAMVASARAAPGPAAAVGTQQWQQAESWLQLERDQKTHRERSAPLSSGDAAALERLERLQRLRRKELEQRQRQSLQLDQRLNPLPSPGPRMGHGSSALRAERQLERQRLDMRLQRDMLAPSPPPVAPVPPPSWAPSPFAPPTGDIIR